MPTIIFYASSRPKGNTHTIADYLATSLDAPKVDLSELEIAYYNYDGQYPEPDQFATLITKALTYNKWLLVTPVYWYTMSTQMKTFLDRLSDRLSDQDDFRPKLTNKQLWVVACGSDPDPVPHFFTPFRLSAEYLLAQNLEIDPQGAGNIVDDPLLGY